MTLIESAGEVESIALCGQILLGRAEIQYRIALMAELCSLEGGREKRVAPVCRASKSGDFVKEHVPGQVLIERPEAVGDP